MSQEKFQNFVDTITPAQKLRTQHKAGYLELYRLILTESELDSLDELMKNQNHNSTLLFNYKGEKVRVKTSASSLSYFHKIRLSILKKLIESRVQANSSRHEAVPNRHSITANSVEGRSSASSRSIQLSPRGSQSKRRLKQIKEQCKILGISFQATINALRQVTKIIGLAHAEGDFGANFMLAQGIEFTIESIELRPFYYEPIVGRISLKDFEIHRCLGIGGFSKVFLVRAKFNGRIYAMKLMVKKFIAQNEKESIVNNQRRIMAQINNPFLVSLHFAFQTKSYIAFILDYCAGGQLFYHLRRIKRMSQEQARFYFIQILCGLNYLHEKRILYRDLKPENLLICIDGHIKIADFGLSKPGIREDELANTFCGSAQYMPPEMLLNQGHTFSVDYYTLGALLYELVCGLPPFYSKDPEQIKRAIIEDQLQFPDALQMSQQLKQLLRGLLAKNPKSRLGSYSGIKQILYHPWVGKVRLADVLAKKLQPPFFPSPDEFNFDKDEMGSDQQQFTAALLNQQKKNTPFRAVFKNFYFEHRDNFTKQIARISTELKQEEGPRTGSNSSTSLRKFNPYLQRQVSKRDISTNSLRRKVSSQPRTSVDKVLQGKGKTTLRKVARLREPRKLLRTILQRQK